MKPEPVIKEEAVIIISFQALALPTQMGSVAQILWGLGDDSKMYQWDSGKKAWVL